MKPIEYIQFSQDLTYEEVNNNERYSINCMLFEKCFWEDIYNGENDDEYMCHVYCATLNKKIIADLSIPMVYLFFFSQRTECKDMLDSIKNIYINFLKLNFPITICTDRLIELENRLRFLETSNKIDNVMIKDLPYPSKKL